MIVTDKLTGDLQNLEWTFSQFDRYYDQIISNLAWLKKEFATNNDHREKTISHYDATIKFRLEQAYANLIHIHELVSNTLINRFKKYYGPFKEELGVGTYNEMRRQIINSFESFLTELKSLLDIAVKFSLEFSLDSSSLPTRIDSFGTLINFITNNGSSKFSSSLLDKVLFNEIIENKEALSECNIYRDYIIHHGFIEISIFTSNEMGNAAFSYQMPTIKKVRKNTYSKDEDKKIDLLYFCKEKMYLIIVILSNIIDRLFDDKSKQLHMTELEKFEPEEIGDVLSELGFKNLRYDRLLDEAGLKEFLQTRKIKFDELIEERRVVDRRVISKKRKRNPQDKDLSHLVTRVFYRLGNIEVMKTFFTYDRDFHPSIDEMVTYAVREQGTSVTDFQNIKNSNQILEHLRGAGLVFAKESSGYRRYISTKDDLDYIVQKLLNLSDFKWSNIQMTEMQFFRKRTEKEIEKTRKILGKRAEDYFRREDINRDKFRKEYEKFKKENAIPPAIVIEGKEKKFKTVISFEQWKFESRDKYKNWRKNQIIANPADSVSRFRSLIPEKYFDQEFASFAIYTSQRWFTRKLHSMDFFRRWLRRDKNEYNHMIVDARQDIIDKIQNYQFLIPAFKTINNDIFTEWKVN